VTTVKIADYNVAIAGTGVTTAKIVDGAVTTAKILNGTIVEGDIADGAITSAKILNGTIAEVDIADGAITSAKILNGTIAAVDIADGAVTTAKILNANVTMDKLAANAVTYAKFQTIPATSILGNSTTGETTVSSNACSAFGFALLGETDAINARSRLGLGSMSTQSSSAVDIIGGTIAGVTLTGSSVDVSSPLGILPTASGGTGRSTYTSGDLLYASGASTIGTLAKGATNLVLHGSGGVSSPTWGLVNLATDVSGLLPVANGGTGLATITGYVKGTGTNALSTSATIPVADILGVLPIAKGGTGPSAYGQISGQIPGASKNFTTSYEKVVITTAEGGLSEFDINGESNRLRYTGSAARKFLFFGSLDIASSVDGAQFSIKLAKGGSTIDATQCNASAAVKGAGTGIAKLVCSWVIEMAQNNYIEIWAASVNSNETAIPQRMRLIATPVF
jgi:hypothetical protein